MFHQPLLQNYKLICCICQPAHFMCDVNSQFPLTEEGGKPRSIDVRLFQSSKPAPPGYFVWHKFYSRVGLWKRLERLCSPEHDTKQALTVFVRRVLCQHSPGKRQPDVFWKRGHDSIEQFHKSHNAPVSYPTIHHSEQKCVHFCSELCIVGYRTGALWDLWDLAY